MKRKVFSKGLIIVATISILGVAGVQNKVMAEELTQNTTQSATQNTTQTSAQNTTTTIKTQTKKEIKSIKNLKAKINTSTVAYTGKKIKPSVKIYDGKKKLKQNKDYTVEYKNNVKTGKAKITVKGIGDYKGTIKKYFYIAPKKAYIKSVFFNSKFTKATIEWKKDNLASGYAVFMSDKKDGKYKRIKKIKNKKITSYTVKNLDPDTMYYFKVCSFKMVNDKIVYSPKESKPKSNTGKLAKISLVSYSSGKNRNFNLKKASKLIDGTILKPGDVFNWFKVVGPASQARGYKKASVFVNKKTVPGYGGGVCQVSTTVYQAALDSGLKILERHQHSKPVSYTSKDRDATVTYGVHNLRFKNNKKYSIKIVTYSKEGRTTCEMYRVED